MNNFDNILKRPNLLRVVISLITVILFLWLLTRIDWLLVLSYLKRIPLWIIICTILLMVLGQILNALRWYIIIRASNIQIPLFKTINIVLSGAFASNFLPSTIGGDLYRALALRRYSKETQICITSIIIDRVVNITVFILLTPFSLLLLILPIINNREPISELIITSSFIKLPFVPNLRNSITKIIIDFRNSINLFIRKPIHILLSFVVSIFSDVVVFYGIYILTQGLGMHVNIFQVIGISVTTYFITLIPISINGYGLREIVITSLYVFLGNTIEQASILAIISRFLMTCVTLLGIFGVSDINNIKNSQQNEIS